MSINKSVRKKDAMGLITGQPVYTDDIAPSNCLVVKLLRSKYAHAIIEDIDIGRAQKLEGIECILTYKDVKKHRFTLAGQTYPEPSPYDRYIMEDRVRHIGDVVAIIAGKDEKTINRAIKMIRVMYKPLEIVLDANQAKDNETLIHPEEDWEAKVDVGGDNKRNLCASGQTSHGNLEKAFAESDLIIERNYMTKAVQQTMMETFRTYTYIDAYGRLNVVSSTQVPFHVRRILANALGIPKSKIKVVKPRIGGGFGAKQTSVSEVYPAIVTMVTKKPAKLVFTREESLIASSPRHEMHIRVKIGASKEGQIKAIDLYTLSNTGAYGEHGPTTVGLSGHKSIPLYTGGLEAYNFSYDVVYTNRMSAGAYRGYGATQGLFALESAVNELASELAIDPVKLRQINMVKEGMIMPAYYNEKLNSCALDRCLARVAKMVDWDKKYPYIDMGNGKRRSVGIAMAMQGSAISFVDKGSVSLKVNDDGFYSMTIGATDMGTGCDTILAQIVAKELNCSYEDIAVFGVDTDVSPYDSGSYASSTTYLTGIAAIKAAKGLKARIIASAARAMEVDKSTCDFEGKKIIDNKSKKEILLKDLANNDMVGTSDVLEFTASHSTEISPPPFMVGAAEVEIDMETGELDLINFYSVVDCGTPINPNLAKVQAEGGIVQGIGMALYEDVHYNARGAVAENSLMQYKIPSRIDIGKIHVEFESSYEPSGPYGAKSIGEVVINTPSPAIAHAIYNATGYYHRSLPISPNKIYNGIQEARKHKNHVQ